MRLSSRLPDGLEEVIDRMGTRRTVPLSEAMSILTELQTRLEQIDEQRDALVALHQQVMMKVAPSIDELTDNYEERQLAHAMLDQPRRPVDLDLFSQSIRIQSSQAEKIMAGLRDRLIRDLAKGKGNVIAGGEGSPYHGGLSARTPYRRLCKSSCSSSRHTLSWLRSCDPI